MRHLAKCVTDFLAWLIVKWKIETAYLSSPACL